jgi:LysM repeat protein
MKLKRSFVLVLFFLMGLFLLAVSPFFLPTANAQVFYYTPTAEANGNVYYVVKEGDTCDTISLLNNIPLETLRSLNQLDLDACRFLQVGQKLLLATVPTAVVTPGPSPTPTSLLPTPEPIKGFGTICVYLYNDINGNAMAEESEITDTGLAGGAISVASQDGSFTKTGTTIGTGEPVCFKEAPEGEYTISIAIPDGYNATAKQNYVINLKAGDTSTIDFSAQAGSSLNTINNEDGGSSSVLLAVVGGIFIVLAVGLGLYARYFLQHAKTP